MVCICATVLVFLYISVKIIFNSSKVVGIAPPNDVLTVLVTKITLLKLLSVAIFEQCHYGEKRIQFFKITIEFWDCLDG